MTTREDCIFDEVAAGGTLEYLLTEAFDCRWVSTLKPTNFTVLIAAQHLMLNGNNPRPTLKQISDICGVSEQTVRKSIHELKLFEVGGKKLLPSSFY
ncbi:hypothetical protein [Peribacillus sp. SCS-37]|uniref:hypothetical protein n=1 Tax=Paraperibacillus esterisolvens TaxID=3115296 RepID=UPI003905C944